MYPFIFPTVPLVRLFVPLLAAQTVGPSTMNFGIEIVHASVVNTLLADHPN